MIKVLGLILTIAGGIGLVMGILGIFGSMETGLSPWARARKASQYLKYSIMSASELKIFHFCPSRLRV